MAGGRKLITDHRAEKSCLIFFHFFLRWWVEVRHTGTAMGIEEYGFVVIDLSNALLP